MTLGIRLMDSGRSERPKNRRFEITCFVVNMIDLDRGHTM